MRTMVSAALLAIGCGCGGGGSGGGGDGGNALECTPEAQQVAGVMRSFERVDLGGLSQGGTCASRLLASAADVDDAFPNTSAPPEVAGVDFAVDRVVLGSSNPSLRFVVDDGATLGVGQEPLCQGIPPSCVAYIVRGTTSDLLAVTTCPYRGPEPCMAP